MEIFKRKRQIKVNSKHRKWKKQRKKKSEKDKKKESNRKERGNRKIQNMTLSEGFRPADSQLNHPAVLSTKYSTVKGI